MWRTAQQGKQQNLCWKAELTKAVPKTLSACVALISTILNTNTSTPTDHYN